MKEKLYGRLPSPLPQRAKIKQRISLYRIAQELYCILAEELHMSRWLKLLKENRCSTPPPIRPSSWEVVDNILSGKKDVTHNFHWWQFQCSQSSIGQSHGYRYSHRELHSNEDSCRPRDFGRHPLLKDIQKTKNTGDWCPSLQWLNSSIFWRAGGDERIHRPVNKIWWRKASKQTNQNPIPDGGLKYTIQSPFRTVLVEPTLSYSVHPKKCGYTHIDVGNILIEKITLEVKST